MGSKQFKAMVVHESGDHIFTRKITTRFIDDLPLHDVLIRVHYSSLNYKDALSASGNKGVTKNYPHTPGVDAAGVVEESSAESFRPGDQVIVTGHDLGMDTPGGFGEYVRAPADWVVKAPENMSLKESMIYGTAGFAAALSVYKLTGNGVTPEQGDILVTGAPGGVGSIAVSILVKSGFQVVALNGKIDQREYLLKLGAARGVECRRRHRQVRKTSSKSTLGGRCRYSRWGHTFDRYTINEIRRDNHFLWKCGVSRLTTYGLSIHLAWSQPSRGRNS